MTDNLIDTLNEITQDIETYKTKSISPALEVTDHTSMASKYLNAESVEAFKNKSSVLSNGKARCVFFAVTVANDNLEEAVKILSKVANDLASQGSIDSILDPISSIKLAKLPGKKELKAVFFYPLVPVEKYDEIVKHEYSIEEGTGTGKVIGETELDLQDGEFIAVCRILHDILKKDVVNFDLNGQLFEIVQDHLKLLPNGSKFLGAKACAIVDLSFPYELHFFNPILPDVKRVQLTYKRHAAMVDDSLKQTSLITGVEYFGKDGKKLY